jgi:RimJ/RimL family protein N-acetyltransferase
MSKSVECVFLFYAKTNEQSRRFWERHNFLPNGDVDEYEDIEFVAMQRRLAPEGVRTLFGGKN